MPVTLDATSLLLADEEHSVAIMTAGSLGRRAVSANQRPRYSPIITSHVRDVIDARKSRCDASGARVRMSLAYTRRNCISSFVRTDRTLTRCGSTTRIVPLQPVS